MHLNDAALPLPQRSAGSAAHTEARELPQRFLQYDGQLLSSQQFAWLRQFHSTMARFC